MEYDAYALKIHIDGSALNNPGSDVGIAGIVEYPDALGHEPEVIFEKRFEEGTNQRMELWACIEALKWAREHVGHLKIARAQIITDSRYVYDHQYRAIDWKKAGWRNRYGRHIDNYDLWNQLITLRPKVPARVDIIWRQGKTTLLSKEVDRLAKEAAHRLTPRKDFGYRPGAISRAKLKGVAVLFPASNQKVTITIQRSDIVGMGRTKEYKVRFALSSDSDQYTAKYFAYASPGIESELHRSHTYTVLFNGDPNYPVITNVIGELHTKDQEK